MTELSLFQKNLVFLDTALPGVASLVRRSTDTITQPVLDETGLAVDIDIGAGRLYNTDAGEFARLQVESWRNSPMRVVVSRPEPESLSDQCTKALSADLAACAGDTLLPIPPAEHAGMLVVVGLGLGLQVPQLLEKMSPRHVVLIEPMEEFMVHSLHALDWQALSAQCTAQGATLDVIVQLDPRAAQKELDELMTRFGASSVDGAYTYVHYQTDATIAIARGFHELVGMKSIMQGYYGDEKLMIENTVSNVDTHEFWMVDGTYQAPHDLAAFIVGSGPSLDQSIEAIRAWQGHAVVFCAGSALQTLLSAGIKPDFQIEKENNETTEARIAHIFERNGGDGETFGVDLMASVSVKAGVTRLFDDKFLFHREFLSSTRMFGDGHHPVVGTGPFSANTAMALATTLGFRKVYLFGCDCGSVDQTAHHAKDTVYHTREGHTQGHNNMPIQVPGNFGTPAWTNSYYLWSRWVFETVIAGAEITAFNCSDGVAIPGALPVRPEDLALPGAPLDKAKVTRAIKGAGRHFEAGRYMETQDVAGQLRSWLAFAQEMRVFMDEVLPTADELHEFEVALTRFLNRCDEEYGGVVVPISGSARGMPPIAGYFINRAADADAHARMMGVFRDVFRTQIENLLGDATGLMESIAADHAREGADTSEMRAAG
ncbi:MAG: DUF115 domain-containing protein [Rhodospirillaceae bacterium]|nr:DUF115 domain-containing protein [Rhodospirillaceae bacterium]MBT5944332.1 DUF115 domain-containing protein [Rhodospirillaceae bacterium]MBT6404257.1 DUF115 domain-containing protein [Rhodospirillaceae bacterium]MBT6534580.1 DUF115 domain-containing protein [Rhodospirillaceae bacterium]MBT7362103.1 DUF115 domain-containing protein [Rhodospirillaceae bacterium]